MAYTSAGDLRLRHLIQVNLDRSDADFGRAVQQRFRGRQSNGSETDLALWEVSHEGVHMDSRARFRFTINDGLSLRPVYEVGSQGTVTVHNDLVVNGNLYVQGAQTIINTETVVSRDKNIALGDRPTATPAEIHGGGVTLTAAAPKTWTYDSPSDSWTSNCNVNIPKGRAFMVDGQVVLNADGFRFPDAASLAADGLWLAGAPGTWPEGRTGAADPDHAAAGLAPGVLLLGPVDVPGSWRIVTNLETLTVERYSGDAWEPKLIVRNTPMPLSMPL